MAKSKNRSHSEIEYLRGEVRRLKAELKYYKRRDHLNSEIIDDIDYDDVQDIVDVRQCPKCRTGILLEYDFVRAILTKCDKCDFEQRKRK